MFFRKITFIYIPDINVCIYIVRETDIKICFYVYTIKNIYIYIYINVFIKFINLK